MIIAGTGHRPKYFDNDYSYTGKYSNYLREETRKILIEHESEQIISGLAQGFDTILALLALELKIPLLAAVPFKGQELLWPKSAQQLYHKILNDPLVETYIVSQKRHNYAYVQRDQWMVDNCNLLIAAFFKDIRSGSKTTYEYAVKINRKIIYLDPNNANFN